jgi:hypothetical protein
MEINKESLEKALKKADTDIKEIKISKEEEIGVHKGALNTLLAERNELIRMIANIEAIMQAHLKRLEELGVKIEQGKK